MIRVLVADDSRAFRAILVLDAKKGGISFKFPPREPGAGKKKGAKAAPAKEAAAPAADAAQPEAPAES